MVKSKLKKNAKKIDQFLISFLKKQNKSLLVPPMKYGVISGGKKIRSSIIIDTGKLLGIKEKKSQIYMLPRESSVTSQEMTEVSLILNETSQKITYTDKYEVEA